MAVERVPQVEGEESGEVVRVAAIVLIVCMLASSGCSRLKGGDTAYGTVTAKMTNEVYWPAHMEYLVNIDADDGQDIWYGSIDEVTYNSVTFGSRVKMTYTGFGNNWVIASAP